MKKRSLLSFAILIISLTFSITTFVHISQALPPTVISPDADRLKLVAHIGGSAEFVATKDNYAYVGTQHGIRIFDITNITAPISIDYILLDWAPIEEIVVSGDYAFVAAGANGLHILSLADPESPEEIGAYDTPHPGYTDHLVVDGNYLYMADWPRGAIIVDISNPASPQEIGRYDPISLIHDVAYANNLLYAANFMDGIHILDVSDPTTPELVGLYQPVQNYGLYHYVEVAGNYLYVLRQTEFYIADISDPTNPTTVATYPTSMEYIALAGDYAYLGGFALQVVDISDPENPNFRDLYLLPDSSNNIDIVGNTAFISNQQNGVRIIDISDPDNLSEIGAYTPTLTRTSDILGYVNDHIYVKVLHDGSSTHIFDVSNPETPIKVGTYDYIYQMIVDGNLAFALNSDIRVLDMSDPVNPNEIGVFPTSWYGPQLAVEGNKLVVVNQDRFLLIDISNPISPTLLGTYLPSPPLNQWGGIDISGDYVYFKESFDYPSLPDNDILHIVSIADPGNPTFINKITTAQPWGAISADGHYVYICCRQMLTYGQYINACCEQIFDVSDPLNVREVSAVLPPQIPPHPYQDWWVMDNKGYVYFAGDGLTVWLYEPIWRSFLPLASR